MKELIIKISDSYYKKAVNYDLDAPTVIIEAIRYGIETTSEDCVSREAVSQMIDKTYSESWNENNFYDRLSAELEVLPCVNPKSVDSVLKDIKSKILRKVNSGQWSEAVIYGMKKAIAAIDEYMNEGDNA